MAKYMPQRKYTDSDDSPVVLWEDLVEAACLESQAASTRIGRAKTRASTLGEIPGKFRIKKVES